MFPDGGQPTERMGHEDGDEGFMGFASGFRSDAWGAAEQPTPTASGGVENAGILARFQFGDLASWIHMHSASTSISPSIFDSPLSVQCAPRM